MLRQTNGRLGRPFCWSSVLSFDEDRVAFAARFGYGDCRTTETGAREIDVRKVATRLSAAND
ncbi:hypothetical protein [Bradyrhizobium acaciae]|uniref:hypothetical protein n=1 Tax=Bradyrhizobium acaciae TaxID=2683706 RepID=UPI001E55D1A5|nr:hypothetical protein [Bradyrhizobium acaciae]MCC8984849.1 hypothetical protein [Bradyrhizobium acaciae]